MRKTKKIKMKILEKLGLSKKNLKKVNEVVVDTIAKIVVSTVAEVIKILQNHILMTKIVSMIKKIIIKILALHLPTLLNN